MKEFISFMLLIAVALVLAVLFVALRQQTPSLIIIP